MSRFYLDVYAGSVEIDTTHDLQLSVRLWPAPRVKIWARARFPTVRTQEGVHGRTFPINGGGRLGP